LLLVELYVIAI